MYILKTEDFIPVTQEEMLEYIGKDYECSKYERTDGKNVIFVEVQE